MLDGMFYWLTGLSNFEVVAALLGIVVLDVPRYLLTNLAMVFYDSGKLAFFRRRRYDPHLPSVCAIISCLNEEETISQTLRSVYGSYPGLEIVVIDDGSTDSTFALASGFAKTHPGVKVIRRPVRGGKGSACNFGLVYTKAEIVVMLDSDSEFGKHAIFHIVQPFREPKVGAVSGAIHVRNVYTGLPTWLQAWEYLATIQVGRILASKLGTLSIASGAFGAYRRSAVLRGYGFDASVAEDLDVTLRLRKSGYKIVFAPLAECYTNAPESFKGLFKQRVRWDRAYLRYEVIKHRSIGNLFARNFRLTSFLYFYENIVLNILLTLVFWVTLAFLLLTADITSLANATLLALLLYTGFTLIQSLVILFYSNNWKRDLPVLAVFPFYMFYAIFLRAARMFALYDEIVNKGSYKDQYVPAYVQRKLLS